MLVDTPVGLLPWREMCLRLYLLNHSLLDKRLGVLVLKSCHSLCKQEWEALSSHLQLPNRIPQLQHCLSLFHIYLCILETIVITHFARWTTNVTKEKTKLVCYISSNQHYICDWSLLEKSGTQIKITRLFLTPEMSHVVKETCNNEIIQIKNK